MKKAISTIILFILKILAKAKLNKMNAEVIAVTGSAGKTSLKDALYLVLSSKYKVKKTCKTFNSEYGLPLDLLNQHSPYGSTTGWVSALILGFLDLLTNGEKYDYYIAEMGVDKKGDMDYLMTIFRPKYSIILNILNVHVGNFKDGFTDYAKEK